MSIGYNAWKKFRSTSMIINKKIEPIKNKAVPSNAQTITNGLQATNIETPLWNN